MSKINTAVKADLKNLLAELNLESYSEDLITLILESPEYLDLLFPTKKNHYQEKSLHYRTQQIKSAFLAEEESE